MKHYEGKIMNSSKLIFKKMLQIFIASVLFTSAHSYSIKVKGNVELGSQVADLFKELRDRFLEYNEGNSATYGVGRNRPKHLYNLADSGGNYGMPRPKDFSFLGAIPFLEKGPENDLPLEEMKEVPLLQEIVQNSVKKVHVYGSHKKEKKTKHAGALNNIQV